MNTRSERGPLAAVLLLAALFASECAHAQEQEVAFRASATATYSDNATRTATGQSATALDGLVGLRVAHQSPLLYVDANASALERAYVEGNLPSETLANGYLNLLAGPAGGLFTWTLTDSFGQISSQPFAALFASDRQNLNVLSTGPNLRIQFDSRDHLDLAARYRLDTYGTSSLDDHGYMGQAELAHDIGSTSHAGVVYAYQRIDFQQGTLAAAKIEQAYAKYRLAGARTYVVLEAGADQLEQGITGRQHTAHVLALVERHLTERLTFEASYRHGYTDAAGAFVAASRDGFTVGTDQTVQALALPFEESQGYAQLTRSAGRLLAAIEITASEETYPGNSASKRRTVGSNLAGDYQLSSSVKLNLRAGYYEEKFPNTQQDGHWLEGSIGLSRMLGRSLQLSLRATRIKSTGNLLNGEFAENRALLSLTYAPGAERLQRIYDTNAPFRFYDRPPPQPPQPPH